MKKKKKGTAVTANFCANFESSMQIMVDWSIFQFLLPKNSSWQSYLSWILIRIFSWFTSAWFCRTNFLPCYLMVLSEAFLHIWSIPSLTFCYLLFIFIFFFCCCSDLSPVMSLCHSLDNLTLSQTSVFIHSVVFFFPFSFCIISLQSSVYLATFWMAWIAISQWTGCLRVSILCNCY